MVEELVVSRMVGGQIVYRTVEGMLYPPDQQIDFGRLYAGPYALARAD
jgi:hypothetical protein